MDRRAAAAPNDAASARADEQSPGLHEASEWTWQSPRFAGVVAGRAPAVG
jgi:hypothetical protein